MRIKHFALPLSSVVVVLLVALAATASSGALAAGGGEAPSPCSTVNVDAGSRGGKQTLRVAVIGQVSCAKARQLTHAYYRKLAAGKCGRLNNFCDLNLPGGWSCSLFFATETAETGGAIAGCARNSARIRLYDAGHGRPSAARGRAPVGAFSARTASGFIAACDMYIPVGREHGVICASATGGDPNVFQEAKVLAGGRVGICTDSPGCPWTFDDPDPGPTLGVGERVTVRPFRCQVLEAGVQCTVIATGRGFLINPNEAVRVVPRAGAASRPGA